MNLSNSRSNNRFSLLSRGKLSPGLIFAVIILTALLAFEIFNYSTTDFALTDLLGDLRFAGVRWATILSIAFCGIDFAGIARLFTPEQGGEEPKEVWYLFGAWLLAATMNAILTWWGVSMAVITHSVSSTTVMSASTLTKVVPIFVAIMVWVIRILIIGSLSMAGDRLLWGHAAPQRRAPAPQRSYTGNSNNQRTPATMPMQAAPAPRPSAARSMEPGSNNGSGRQEPTYHSLSFTPRPMPKPTQVHPKGRNDNSSNEGSAAPRRRL